MGRHRWDGLVAGPQTAAIMTNDGPGNAVQDVETFAAHQSRNRPAAILPILPDDRRRWRMARSGPILGPLTRRLGLRDLVDTAPRSPGAHLSQRRPTTGSWASSATATACREPDLSQVRVAIARRGFFRPAEGPLEGTRPRSTRSPEQRARPKPGSQALSSEPRNRYRSPARRPTSHHATGKIPAAMASLMASPMMNGVKPREIALAGDTPREKASHGTPMA